MPSDEIIEALREWIAEYDFRRINDEDPLSDDVDFADTLLRLVRQLTDDNLFDD